VLGFLTLFILLGVLHKRSAVEAATATVLAPRFEVDPLWPKPLPNHWILGETIGVSVDSQDHVWIIHRPGLLEPFVLRVTTNPPVATCCAPAPPILEFDQEGNLLRHWGGPGEGYEWPIWEHGITVDYKGNVWLGSSGPVSGIQRADGMGTWGFLNYPPGLSDKGVDAQVLKFTQDGKFLMQIGKRGQSKGSNDTENLGRPCKIVLDKKNNEIYVADGYANHRVIVYDADTGKFKRYWGAYGHKPDDTNLGDYDPDAPPAQQFGNSVHCVAFSNDDLLYVCDRPRDRIQVFKPDGTFVREAFIEKRTRGSGSTWDIAFSSDPQQKYMYVADGSNEQVHILLRDTLQVLTSFGDGGRQPGQFYGVHSIATDSKGNIYTTETYRGQRVQRFLYKGIGPVAKDQGVPWPQGQH
jgi:DNA-binding beta-propeller fold protein YncE